MFFAVDSGTPKKRRTFRYIYLQFVKPLNIFNIRLDRF